MEDNRENISCRKWIALPSPLSEQTYKWRKENITHKGENILLMPFTVILDFLKDYGGNDKSKLRQIFKG